MEHMGVIAGKEEDKDHKYLSEDISMHCGQCYIEPANARRDQMSGYSLQLFVVAFSILEIGEVKPQTTICL